MVYIIAKLIKKAFKRIDKIKEAKDLEDMWTTLMLTPLDYSKIAINDDVTRNIMSKIEFKHGGPEYDAKYPEGIPTSMQVHTKTGQVFDSGLVMFPDGHARCKDVYLNKVLSYKFNRLSSYALQTDDMKNFLVGLANIDVMSNEELIDIYDCNIQFTELGIDDDPK